MLLENLNRNIEINSDVLLVIFQHKDVGDIVHLLIEVSASYHHEGEDGAHCQNKTEWI